MKKAAMITTGLLAALIMVIATVGAGTAEAQRFRFKKHRAIGHVSTSPIPLPVPWHVRAVGGVNAPIVKNRRSGLPEPFPGPKGNYAEAIPINLP